MSKILEKIEEDILKFFEDSFSELKGNLLPLPNSLEKIEREFTGAGAFISFIFNNKVKENKTLSNKRFGGDIFLVSNEFLHDVPISIVFNQKGILDYIELEMGMKEKKYPSHYKIEIIPINVIKD
jgi:hypothetical protein